MTAIKIDKLTKKYKDLTAVDSLDLEIEEGELFSLLGVNGAGKTTLVKLMLRFYDVTEGEILYNGVNIKEYTTASLRRRFATVFQDYKTFALSVYENVICHEPDSEERKKAEEALKQSGVWDKICEFENGGDTVLTREFEETGAGLSGGETQKTAVARMFAKNFDIRFESENIVNATDFIAKNENYTRVVRVKSVSATEKTFNGIAENCGLTVIGE